MPAVLGTVQEGSTVTVETVSIADADGLGAFSYQWLRDGVDIAGATSFNYTLVPADVGAQISVRVSYTDGGGTLENVTSPLTSAVIASGTNDAPTFAAADGVVIHDLGSSTDDKATESIVQPDGKILVGGYSNDDFAVVRYNTDGSLDASFGTNGIALVDSANDQAATIALQSDGKILIAGFSYGNAMVARLNADGGIDTSFGTNGIAILASADAYSAEDLLVQSDGKILVAGSGWVNYPGNIDASIVRLNANGTVDTSFGSSGYVVYSVGVTTDATELAFQSDGKLIVTEKHYDGSNWNLGIRRYTSNGSLDTTFGVSGYRDTGIDGGYSDIHVNSDDSIVSFGTVGNNFTIKKWTSNGALDTSFGTSGTTTLSHGMTEIGYNVGVQSDGKYLLSGGSNGNLSVARINTDGSVDTGFGTNGIYVTTISLDNVSAEGDLSVNSDDSFQIIGTQNNGDDDFVIARFNSDGTLSGTFDEGGGGSSLNATPSFVQGSGAVVLDANVQVYDDELSTVDNFSGASVTLERNGGANGDDEFSASGNLSTLTQGGSFSVGGTTIGTVTTNSGGTLVLTFNSNATNALVNQAMQQIAYSNGKFCATSKCHR